MNTNTNPKIIKDHSIYGFSKKLRLPNEENETMIGIAAQCIAQIKELNEAKISNVLFFTFIINKFIRVIPFFGY